MREREEKEDGDQGSMMDLATNNTAAQPTQESLGGGECVDEAANGGESTADTTTATTTPRKLRRLKRARSEKGIPFKEIREGRRRTKEQGEDIPLTKVAKRRKMSKESVSPQTAATTSGFDISLAAIAAVEMVLADQSCHAELRRRAALQGKAIDELFSPKVEDVKSPQDNNEMKKEREMEKKEEKEEERGRDREEKENIEEKEAVRIRQCKEEEEGDGGLDSSSASESEGDGERRREEREREKEVTEWFPIVKEIFMSLPRQSMMEVVGHASTIAAWAQSKRVKPQHMKQGLALLKSPSTSTEDFVSLPALDTEPIIDLDCPPPTQAK